jgi:ligand-binding sensor domain-containing protein
MTLLSVVHSLPFLASRGRKRAPASSLRPLIGGGLLLILLLSCFSTPQPAPESASPPALLPTPYPSQSGGGEREGAEAPVPPTSPDGHWTTFANGDDVQALALEGDHLWAGTRNGGLVRWDIVGGTYEQVLYPQDGLACNDVRDVVVDGHGDKWLATCRGVSVLSDEGAISTTYTANNSALPHDDVTALAVDGSGRIWMGTDGGGVAVFNGADWQVYNQDNGLAANEVTALAVDSLGRVWVSYGSAGHGVSVYENDEWTTITRDPEGLASDRVMAIAGDDQGRVWFGTWGSGVSMLAGDQWTTYTRRDGLASNYVWAIAAEEGGRIWFAAGASGGTGRGVTAFDGETWQTYTTDDELASDTVWAIASGASGHVWFGTTPACSGFTGCKGGGVSRFDVDQDEWTTYTTAQVGLASNQITALAFDAEGRTWVGTEGSGVSVFDGQAWQTYTVGDGLGSNLIRDIAVDATGNVWVGTKEYLSGGSFAGGGVSVFDGQGWQVYTTTHGLASNDVSALAIDGEGKVWIGTGDLYDYSGYGLSVFDVAKDRWQIYTYPTLTSNHITDLACDKAGNKVWAATAPYIVPPGERVGGGVSLLDGSTWITYTTKNSELVAWEDQPPLDTGGDIRSIAVDGDGVAWIGDWIYEAGPAPVEPFDAVVNRFDGHTWKAYTFPDEGYISAIAVEGGSRVWVGTILSGAKVFAGDTFLPYTTANSELVSDKIQAIAVDEFGDKWFGTADAGLSLFRESRCYLSLVARDSR